MFSSSAVPHLTTLNRAKNGALAALHWNNSKIHALKCICTKYVIGDVWHIWMNVSAFNSYIETEHAM